MAAADLENSDIASLQDFKLVADKMRHQNPFGTAFDEYGCIRKKQIAVHRGEVALYEARGLVVGAECLRQINDC
jgi:hypothetical protein